MRRPKKTTMDKLCRAAEAYRKADELSEKADEAAYKDPVNRRLDSVAEKLAKRSQSAYLRFQRCYDTLITELIRR